MGFSRMDRTTVANLVNSISRIAAACSPDGETEAPSDSSIASLINKKSVIDRDIAVLEGASAVLQKVGEVTKLNFTDYDLGLGQTKVEKFKAFVGKLENVRRRYRACCEYARKLETKTEELEKKVLDLNNQVEHWKGENSVKDGVIEYFKKEFENEMARRVQAEMQLDLVRSKIDPSPIGQADSTSRSVTVPSNGLRKDFSTNSNGLSELPSAAPGCKDAVQQSSPVSSQPAKLASILAQNGQINVLTPTVTLTSIGDWNSANTIPGKSKSETQPQRNSSNDHHSKQSNSAENGKVRSPGKVPIIQAVYTLRKRSNLSSVCKPGENQNVSEKTTNKVTTAPETGFATTRTLRSRTQGLLSPSEINGELGALRTDKRNSSSPVRSQMSSPPQVPVEIPKPASSNGIGAVSNPDKKYSCSTCGTKFGVLKNLARHIKYVHKEEFSSKYECSYCKKRFYQRCNLEQHVRRHTGERPFSCPICKKVFQTKHGHKNHMLIHNPNRKRTVSCHRCPKKFYTIAELNKHVVIHQDSRPFTCEICGKGFKTSHELKNMHMKVHSEVRPHKCKECGREFKRASEVKCHMRLHTGERPFPCPTCPKSFTRSSHLITHVRIHTGEKPYKCKICSRAFNQRSGYKRHIVGIHKLNWKTMES